MRIALWLIAVLFGLGSLATGDCFSVGKGQEFAVGRAEADHIGHPKRRTFCCRDGIAIYRGRGLC